MKFTKGTGFLVTRAGDGYYRRRQVTGYLVALKYGIRAIVHRPSHMQHLWQVTEQCTGSRIGYYYSTRRLAVEAANARLADVDKEVAKAKIQAAKAVLGY